MAEALVYAGVTESGLQVCSFFINHFKSMKYFSAAVALLLTFFFFSFTDMNKTTRVVFFGDSITEAAVEPGGYIVQMREMLAAEGKSSDYDLIGAGVGGNKVYDLYLRLEKDVLGKKPDVVAIYVGVNDVWHKRLYGTGTDADKFGRFYEALISKMRDAGIRVILCTPACIGEKTDCTNTQDGELNQYAQIIRDLAEAYHCSLCDFRTAFQQYNTGHNPENKEKGILTTDGVHLNDAGNQLVAGMLLKKIREN